MKMMYSTVQCHLSLLLYFHLILCLLVQQTEYCLVIQYSSEWSIVWDVENPTVSLTIVIITTFFISSSLICHYALYIITIFIYPV